MTGTFRMELTGSTANPRLGELVKHEAVRLAITLIM
jgi:hypothetical protein